MKTKRAQILGVSAFLASGSILFCAWGCTSQPTPAPESMKPAQATQAPAQPAITPEATQMHPAMEGTGPEMPAMGQPMESAKTPAAPAMDTHQATTIYVVHSGDTLAGISKKYYGTEANWMKILEANRNVLKSPKDLRPNMKLVIPAAKAGTSALSPAGSQTP